MEIRKINNKRLLEDISAFFKQQWKSLLIILFGIAILRAFLFVMLSNSTFTDYLTTFLHQDTPKHIKVLTLILPILCSLFFLYTVTIVLLLCFLRSRFYRHIIGHTGLSTQYFKIFLKIAGAFFIIQFLDLITTPLLIVPSIIQTIFVFVIPMLLIRPTLPGIWVVFEQSRQLIRGNFWEMFLWVGLWQLIGIEIDKIPFEALDSLYRLLDPILSAFIKDCLMIVFISSTVFLYKQFMEIKQANLVPKFDMVEMPNKEQQRIFFISFVFLVSLWTIKSELEVVRDAVMMLNNIF